MYLVYVLYSQKFNKIYIGQTIDLIKRLEEHNTGSLSPSSYTKRYKPWEVIHTEEFETRGEALKREKQLKSHQGRNWICNTLLNEKH